MSERAKKYTIIVLVSIAVISVLFAVYIASDLFFSRRELPAPDTAQLSLGYSFVLKDVDGKIGIFMPSETEPFVVLEIYTQTLPDFDRANLIKGINVKDTEELNQLIEDFDS